MEKKEKQQICSIVCQAILIDSTLTDQEENYLIQLMDRFELNDEERKQVRKRNIDDDVVEMAKSIESDDAKKILVEEVYKVIAVDGHRSNVENRLLQNLAVSFDYSKSDVEEIIQNMLERMRQNK
ncbi:MAG: TerB family tellurite resistance protein [Deltaproteobacteria bacterium]|nr:TerB family tellurite resistance protein [Deltaproteobacteria bacterium]